MTGRIKILVLAALAATALVAALAAAATASEFTSATSPTWLKGEQATQNTFTFNGGFAKCTGAVYTSQELTPTAFPVMKVHPAYSGCTAFGQAATVTTTGCDYWLTASSTTVGAMEFVCTGGSVITVKANIAGCTVKMAAQVPATPKVDYAAASTETFGGFFTHLNLELVQTIEGITYTSSGGICGTSGANGKLTGSLVVKGFDTSSYTWQHSIGVE